VSPRSETASCRAHVWCFPKVLRDLLRVGVSMAAPFDISARGRSHSDFRDRPYSPLPADVGISPVTSWATQGGMGSPSSICAGHTPRARRDDTSKNRRPFPPRVHREHSGWSRYWVEVDRCRSVESRYENPGESRSSMRDISTS